MKLIAIIIAYNPDLPLLKENIGAYYNLVDAVYVWDNSSKQTSESTAVFLRNIYSNIVIEGNGQNMGVSYGLNQGWNYARQSGFDVVLTMDQDSRFESFATYKQRVLTKWEQEGYCLCGPTPNLQIKGSADLGFIKCIAIITSGMLVPTKLLDLVNGYCADFLVDAIDFDLCYKIREKGYEVYMDNASNLIQIFGSPQYKSMFGMKIHAYGYSPFRIYGIFRNHIIVWRRYHHPAILMRHIIKQYLLNYLMMGVLFVEDNKWAKIKAACKGITDGFKFKV